MNAHAIIENPRRPVLRWHGGKWLLAPWIISNFPPHRVYVEPFGGAASVLIRKDRAPVEVYNDLDDTVVGMFRVLQDPVQARRLVDLLRVTPFARAEFELSYEPADCPVERARRLVIRSYMGFGTNAHTHSDRGTASTGFRANSNQSNKQPARDWASFPDALPAAIERFRGVVIEHRDAAAVMSQHDGADTLHYVDPPYLPSTRDKGTGAGGMRYAKYRHELDDTAHVALLDRLRALHGMVLLSGYPHASYDDALPGWRRIERKALADGARERTEVLWINPPAVAALAASTHQNDMFATDPTAAGIGAHTPT